MTYKDFPLWLEGVFDANPNGLGNEQVALIRQKMTTLTFPKAPAASNNVPSHLVNLRC